MKSVHEVCKLSGVSRRTLQYYDEIGLLPPSAVTESGYRQYDDESLRRLWSILFYKELGLSLKDIRLILDSPKEMEKEIMREHKQVLLEKQAQIKRMIHSVDRILHDEFNVSMFRDFDRKRIEEFKRAHAHELQVLKEKSFFLPVVKSREVRNLLNKQSVVKRTSQLIHTDFDKLISFAETVIQKFYTAMEHGPDSLAAKEAVASYREFIQFLFPCDDHTFRSIGQAYLEQKKELDKKMPGLAEFVSTAIRNVYPSS
jgi:DNA-binding transcriptional MerR regulator